LAKINILKIEEFKEIKIEYLKSILLEDKTKIVGIKKDPNLLEVYNIQNECVETTIKLDTYLANYNNFLKEDILLLVIDIKIYLINPKIFSIEQTIYLQRYEPIAYNSHEFIYGDILSKDSIGIIYKGDLVNLVGFEDSKYPCKDDAINSNFEYQDFSYRLFSGIFIFYFITKIIQINLLLQKLYYLLKDILD